MVTIVDLAAIASAGAGLLLAAFAVIQLQHMEKHRNVDISMKLFEWAENERLRKALRWVEEEFQFEDYEGYKASRKTSFEVSEYPYEVAAFFEQVGFWLTESSWILMSSMIA